MENTTRFTVPFTPLEERIAVEAPELLPGLNALRRALGDQDFDTYVNSLVSLRRIDDRLLIITKRAMFRSIIIGRFLPAFQESFDVRYVQVFNQ